MPSVFVTEMGRSNKTMSSAVPSATTETTAVAATNSSSTVCSSVSVVLGVVSVSDPLDDCVETAVGSSDVFHETRGSVSFFQGVRAFDVVSFPYFVLLLLVTCVGVCYSVGEFVVSWSLK